MSQIYKYAVAGGTTCILVEYAEATVRQLWKAAAGSASQLPSMPIRITAIGSGSAALSAQLVPSSRTAPEFMDAASTLAWSGYSPNSADGSLAARQRGAKLPRGRVISTAGSSAGAAVAFPSDGEAL